MPSSLRFMAATVLRAAPNQGRVSLDPVTQHGGAAEIHQLLFWETEPRRYLLTPGGAVITTGVALAL